MSAPSSFETRFKQILFCTDFSESADAAFPFALDATLRRPGSVLHILHVVHEADAQFWRSYLAEVEEVETRARQAIDAKIESAYLARVPAGVPVRIQIADGPDADTILTYAREQRIDLIVIGRHGHGRMHKTLFGGVAEKIVRKAPCVVMVVPLEYAAGAPPSSSRPTPG